MQRKLSSFDIYVIISELQRLKESYIEKIYQLSRDELLVKVKNTQTKQKESLYIRNGELICITQKPFETPMKPSTFAMTLRKYLQNGRISDISQHAFDRIIKIRVRKKTGEYTLVLELFSNGNIILLDTEEKIILPLIQQRWAHRTVRGKEPYLPPPSQINPFELTLDTFSEVLKRSEADLVRTLAVKLNLSGFIAEEICARGNIEKSIKTTEMNDELILKTYDTLTAFLRVFEKKQFNPVLVKHDQKVIDILPFPFTSYEHAIFESIPSFVQGLENFIEKKETQQRKEENQTEKLIEKLKRQLTQQEETVKKLKEKIELKKREGDLIYLHYQECETLLREINKLLELKEKNQAVQRINRKTMVKTFDPTENILQVYLTDTTGETFEITLDFRKTVSENAEKAYEQRKKLQSKLRGAERAIKQTREQLEQTRKKAQEIESREKPLETKKERTYWFERFRWFISSDGNIVIAGKDAKSNELIVKKYLKEGDRYAHADVQGAPSCVVKSKNIDDELVPISEKTLNEACLFSSCYSKAWKQFTEAQAYWVHPEQVSKTPQSGEFVPKGAFIIRGKRHYCKCKLELAVGVVKIHDTEKLMGGPVDAVRQYAEKYIVFQPGHVGKTQIAHQLASVFNMPVDQVNKVLPPGGITIVKTIGLELQENG